MANYYYFKLLWNICCKNTCTKNLFLLLQYSLQFCNRCFSSIAKYNIFAKTFSVSSFFWVWPVQACYIIFLLRVLHYYYEFVASTTDSVVFKVQQITCDIHENCGSWPHAGTKTFLSGHFITFLLENKLFSILYALRKCFPWKAFQTKFKTQIFFIYVGQLHIQYLGWFCKGFNKS